MAGLKQPADKSHFLLPDLGEGVHEAELIKWKVNPGQRVEEHQTLAEMETDKALVEVPSPWTGVVMDLGGHSEGDIVNVGDILVNYKIGEASTTPAENGNSTSAIESKSEEREDAGTVVGSVGAAVSIPEQFTRREHESNGPATATKALATPAVRRIAKEAGIDINRVPGNGRGGRVTATDVQAFISTSTGGIVPAIAVRPSIPHVLTAPVALPIEPVLVTEDGTSQVIPIRGIRRKIAQALEHSVKTAVHFTVCDEVDVTALNAKRLEYARVLGQKISLLPFIMTACCRALRMHPALNANVDDTKNEIHLKGVINLGVAVDTDHGLMVPVIEKADRLSIVQMSEAIGAIAAGSRDRSIEREKLSGGTFTISNVGSYGGMFATPIINYPEVAILAAGRAKERVMTKNGTFYAGLMLPLSLSCDHRVVDGAEGTRFLNTIAQLLENPEQIVGA
ncbi:MAG: dihydrolipoamide acetyltransferase family protein [Planctomycetota bacterium]|nr:dihydrolipoamide acetyltransferase family protein [Planctomycetota bacterium]